MVAGSALVTGVFLGLGALGVSGIRLGGIGAAGLAQAFHGNPAFGDPCPFHAVEFIHLGDLNFVAIAQVADDLAIGAGGTEDIHLAHCVGGDDLGSGFRGIGLLGLGITNRVIGVNQVQVGVGAGAVGLFLLFSEAAGQQCGHHDQRQYQRQDAGMLFGEGAIHNITSLS